MATQAARKIMFVFAFQAKLFLTWICDRVVSSEKASYIKFEYGLIIRLIYANRNQILIILTNVDHDSLMMLLRSECWDNIF